MVGKTWSEKEEKLFWKAKIPQSPKSLGLDKLRIEKSWKDLAVEMRKEMGNDARREYGALMLFEHFFQNAVNERFSPHAAFYVLDYIKKYETQHGETPAHHRKMGKYDTRRPEPDEHEVASGDASKSRKNASSKTSVKVTPKHTETAAPIAKHGGEARGTKHKRVAQGTRSEKTSKYNHNKASARATPVIESPNAVGGSPFPDISSRQGSPLIPAVTISPLPAPGPVQGSSVVQGPAGKHVPNTATGHPAPYPYVTPYQGFQPSDYEAAATIRDMKSQATSHNSGYYYGYNHSGYAQNNYAQNGYAQYSYTPNVYGQGPYGQNAYGQQPYAQNMYGYNGQNHGQNRYE